MTILNDKTDCCGFLKIDLVSFVLCRPIVYKRIYILNYKRHAEKFY